MHTSTGNQTGRSFFTSTKAEDNLEQITQTPKQLFQSGYGQRYWLKNHGKQEFIPFSDNALKQLRKYFDSLDQKQCGSIGVEELEDPFIAFGLSQSREEVQELIDSVDQDGSGKIQFDQFLSIMLKIKRGRSSGGQANKNSAMYDFFQKMSTGQLGKQFDKNLTFKMNVSQFRRKQLLDSIMSQNKQKNKKELKYYKILKNKYLLILIQEKYQIKVKKEIYLCMDLMLKKDHRSLNDS